MSDGSECEGASERDDVDPFWSESDVQRSSRSFSNYNLIRSSDMLSVRKGLRANSIDLVINFAQ